MKLRLTKPIVFFDLETTGVDTSRDRIVEISYIKVFPDGREDSKVLRINPGVHIPESASSIHHIYDDDVRNSPRFAEVASELRPVFEGCDLAGFNSNRFDIPLLLNEFSRVGIDIDLSESRMVDVQVIYHKLEPRNLSAAYKFYCHKDLAGAHSANSDVRATYEVLQAQLDYYQGELKNDVDFLAGYSRTKNVVDLSGKLTRTEAGEVAFSFGKYRGQSVLSVYKSDPGYVDWVLEGEFPQDTKAILRNILEKRRQ